MFTLLGWFFLALAGQVSQTSQVETGGWRQANTDGQLEYVIHLTPEEVQAMLNSPGGFEATALVPQAIQGRFKRVVVRISKEIPERTPSESQVRQQFPAYPPDPAAVSAMRNRVEGGNLANIDYSAPGDLESSRPSPRLTDLAQATPMAAPPSLDPYGSATLRDRDVPTGNSLTNPTAGLSSSIATPPPSSIPATGVPSSSTGSRWTETTGPAYSQPGFSDRDRDRDSATNMASLPPGQIPSSSLAAPPTNPGYSNANPTRDRDTNISSLGQGAGWSSSLPAAPAAGAHSNSRPGLHDRFSSNTIPASATGNANGNAAGVAPGSLLGQGGRPPQSSIDSNSVARDEEVYLLRRQLNDVQMQLQQMQRHSSSTSHTSLTSTQRPNLQTPADRFDREGNESTMGMRRASGNSSLLPIFFLLSFVINLYAAVYLYQLRDRYRALLSSVRSSEALAA
ncbi:MAG: hypothetical protein ACK5S3_09110 [Pirellulaceae bacterium]